MNELIYDQGKLINLSEEEKDRWGFKRYVIIIFNKQQYQ